MSILSTMIETAILGLTSGGGTTTPSVEYIFAGVSQSIATSATPTTGSYVGFASDTSSAYNGLMVKAGRDALQYRRNGAGTPIDIEPNETKLILGITNTSEIGFRRRDYAEAATNQVTTVTAQPILTSKTYSVTHALVTMGNGAVYTALPSTACTAVYLRNQGFKRFNYKVNGVGVGVPLKRGEGILITGIANANQVSTVSFDSQSGAYAMAEIFNGNMPEQPSRLGLAERISAEALIYLDDLSGIYAPMPNLQAAAGVASFAPFSKWNSKGRTLARIDYLANINWAYTAGAAGVTFADVAPSEDAPGYETIGNTFSTDATPVRRAVRATWGAGSAGVGVRVSSTLGNQSDGINVTGGYIFSRIKKISGAANQLYLQLYSEGSPAAPSANYHELAIQGDQRHGGGYSRADGHGYRSYPVAKFAAVGTGADLTAVKWAAWRVVGGASLVVQFEELKYVAPAFDRAHLYIVGDDSKPSFLRGIKHVMDQHGFPGVLYLSPMASTLGVNRSITVEDALRAQFDGWQIGTQDYRDDISTNNSIIPFQMQFMKQLTVGAAYGFDLDGMRDSSIYGGGISNSSDTQIYHSSHRWRATTRGFDTAWYFPDTMPPGDPHDLCALGASAYGQADRNAILAGWQSYILATIEQKGMAYLVFHDEGEAVEILAAFKMLCPWLMDLQNQSKIMVTTPLKSRRMYGQLAR